MPMDPSINEMQEYFFHLYGRRNGIYFSGLITRITALNIVIGDLQEAIRKNQSIVNIGMALARIVGRIYCVADNFKSLNLVDAMIKKYPESWCSYCGSAPCQCPENRKDPDLMFDAEMRFHQIYWQLTDWQSHLTKIYGSRNKEKGLENLLNRLSKEVSELFSLQARIPNLDMSLNQIESEFALELADTMAWTIAIANFYGINLQEEVFKRYSNGCWKCHQNPCECRGISFTPIDWSKVEIT